MFPPNARSVVTALRLRVHWSFSVLVDAYSPKSSRRAADRRSRRTAARRSVRGEIPFEARAGEGPRERGQPAPAARSAEEISHIDRIGRKHPSVAGR